MRMPTIVTILQLSLAMAVAVEAQVELPVSAKMDIYRAGGYNTAAMEPLPRSTAFRPAPAWS
jgi:hypothetical protein